MESSELIESIERAVFALLPSPTWAADEFCHYTNLQSLLGIVDSNEIWLSDSRFLNDKQEYLYGKNLAIEAIEEFLKQEGDESFKKFLLDVKSEVANGKTAPYDYVASMSFGVDDLDQWKGYGSSKEGVCILFSGDFDLWNAGNTHPAHIQQRRIIYERQEQERLLREIINIYKRPFFKVGLNSIPIGRAYFVIQLAGALVLQYVCFKNPVYASEKELRLTIANNSNIKHLKKLQYRIRNDMIVPYITTKYISNESAPELKRLPIKKIIVNHQASTDTINSIKNFLTHKEFSHVEVARSPIEFRG